MKGYQRYKRKNCGYQYTKTKPSGKPEKDKYLGIDTMVVGIIDERYGQNRQGGCTKCNEMDMPNLFQRSLIFHIVTEVEMDENQNHNVRKTIDFHRKMFDRS